MRGLVFLGVRFRDTHCKLVSKVNVRRASRLHTYWPLRDTRRKYCSVYRTFRDSSQVQADPYQVQAGPYNLFLDGKNKRLL